MIKNLPPDGQSLVPWHKADGTCPCHPDKIVKRKQASSGAYGRHQGYKTEVVLQHHFLPKA